MPHSTSGVGQVGHIRDPVTAEMARVAALAKAEMRLRYNNIFGTSAANPITFSSGGTTTGSWVSSPGFPTIASPNYVAIVVEPNTANEEIVYLTAYTSGGTSGTFTRAQEGTSGITHTATAWSHSPTVFDFTPLWGDVLTTAHTFYDTGSIIVFNNQYLLVTTGFTSGSSGSNPTGPIIAPAGGYNCVALGSSAAALAAYVLASPAITGVGTAVTGATGDASTRLATDAFVATAVSNAIAGVNPAVAVDAATTAAGDTSSYTFAGAGVGATMTGPTNTATTIDVFTFTTVGQRLLVKNDTQSPSGAHDGIYMLTALHTAGTGDIFTRSLDYDTPSDINNTGVIPVKSGTTNGGSSWLQTATIVTVDTTPMTWLQFTYPVSEVMITPTYDPAAIAQQVVGTTATQTITNKRVTRRTTTTSGPGATPTSNTDSYDVIYYTALAAAITSMTTNQSGTPVAGDMIIYGFTDNGTARAITWGANFEASTVALPTTTVISTLLLVGFIWNAVTSKWRCIAVA